MPLQATTTFQNLQQPEGRSRMISLSWNDQTLSKPQRCSPKPKPSLPNASSATCDANSQIERLQMQLKTTQLTQRVLMLEQQLLQQKQDFHKTINNVAIRLNNRISMQLSKEDEPCSVDSSTSLFDLVHRACNQIGKEWTTDAKLKITNNVMLVVTPTCGAPYSIAELRAMTKDQWAADVVTPLSDKIGGHRAIAIVENMQHLLNRMVEHTSE